MTLIKLHSTYFNQMYITLSSKGMRIVPILVEAITWYLFYLKQELRNKLFSTKDSLIFLPFLANTILPVSFDRVPGYRYPMNISFRYSILNLNFCFGQVMF